MLFNTAVRELAVLDHYPSTRRPFDNPSYQNNFVLGNYVRDR